MRDASSIVRESLIGDGVRVIEGGKAVAIERTDRALSSRSSEMARTSVSVAVTC
jgi:hypothetical protein